MMGDSQRHHIQQSAPALQNTVYRNTKHQRSRCQRITLNLFTVLELCLSLAVIISAGSSFMHAISGFIWFTGISAVLVAIGRLSADLMGIFDVYDYNWLGVDILIQLCWLIFHWTAASIASAAAKQLRSLSWDTYGSVSNCYSACAFFSWLASLVYLVLTIIASVFLVKERKARNKVVVASGVRPVSVGTRHEHTAEAVHATKILRVDA